MCPFENTEWMISQLQNFSLKCSELGALL